MELANFVLSSIYIILENYTVTFNSTHYRQLKEAALGPKYAPAYAALCLGYLDVELYDKVERTFSKSTETHFKTKYRCCLATF